MMNVSVVTSSGNGNPPVRSIFTYSFYRQFVQVLNTLRVARNPLRIQFAK